jgi:hypothetical protein
VNNRISELWWGYNGCCLFEQVMPAPFLHLQGLHSIHNRVVVSACSSTFLKHTQTKARYQRTSRHCTSRHDRQANIHVQYMQSMYLTCHTLM